MDITIYDLVEDDIDLFINQDSDYYARVIDTHRLEGTVDLLLNVITVAIDEHNIIIEWPNGNALAVKLDSCHYHKIEVM